MRVPYCDFTPDQKAASRAATARWREKTRGIHRRKRKPKLFYKERAGRPRPTVCECCGNPSSRPLNFDHDHQTGKFRGWLCLSCNIVLGHVQDSPEALRRLAAYLERHQT